MIKSKRDSTKLKEKVGNRWLDVLGALAPSLHHAIHKTGTSVPCPINGGTDGFRLFGPRDRYPTSQSGGGVSHSYRVFPDGVDLLMWVNNWSFPQAFDEIEAWLGDKIVNVGPVYEAKVKEVDDTSLRNWLNFVWEESISLEDTKAYPARAYFSSRRMLTAAKAAKNIRFHPNLKYKDSSGELLGVYGAVLCKVQNNEGSPVQISRIYLNKNGTKVDLGKGNKAKKQTPCVKKHIKGRHVKLFEPINGYIGVCEGVETALAVYEAKQFPVWPNLTATNLFSFLVLGSSGIHTVLNFVD